MGKLFRIERVPEADKYRWVEIKRVNLPEGGQEVTYLNRFYGSLYNRHPYTKTEIIK